MKTYFPALDILRFVAATTVMVGHAAWIMRFWGMESFMSDSMVIESGKAGVAVFFALSGFLLTRTILIERDTTKGFSVKQFYKKRALRILPLYYVLTLVVFFVLPHTSAFYLPENSEELNLYFWQKFGLFVVGLPQLNDTIYQSYIPGSLPFWTIGVEILFYLLLPVIMLSKRPLGMFIGLFVVFTVCKYGLRLFVGHTAYENIISKAFHFFFVNRFDCLAIGGIAAILQHQKHKWATTLASRDNVIFGTGMIVLFQIFHRRFIGGFDYVLYSAAILPFLIHYTQESVSISQNAITKLFVYGGKISYSIYLTHFIVLTVVWYLLYNNTMLSGSNFSIAILTIGTTATYLVSAITYQLIEKPFLKLKGV